jgi:hypothetical protein
MIIHSSGNLAEKPKRERAVVEREYAAACHNAGPGQVLDNPGNPIGWDHGVGVGAGDDVAASLREAGPERMHVALFSFTKDLNAQRRRNVVGLVGAGVIDNDYFQVAVVVLPFKRRNALGNQFFFVVGRHNDRNRRSMLHALSGVKMKKIQMDRRMQTGSLALTRKTGCCRLS